MKFSILLSTLFLLIFTACRDNNPINNNNSLSCEEYWAEVDLASFCGLSNDNFEFNDIAVDICHADSDGNTYAFDDLVYIRVYNGFSNAEAKKDYDEEVDFYQSVTGFTFLNNVGDEAFGIIETEFNKLDNAIIQVLKGQYTIYLEVNGDSSNGSNNCFDENSVIEFAKALADPL